MILMGHLFHYWSGKSYEEILGNYKPVSNLSFIFQLIEKLLCVQVDSYPATPWNYQWQDAVFFSGKPRAALSSRQVDESDNPGISRYRYIYIVLPV